MISFKNFLLEIRGVERTKKINEDEVIELLASNYSKDELSVIFLGNNHFYRGAILDSDLMFCSPKLNRRISPNAHNNFYNIFLSNNIRWKSYPPREYSAIGTTSLKRTKFYGFNYLCIPLNKQANIGIAPKEDIWFSFKTLTKLGFETLNEFFTLIENCMSYNKITYYNDLREELEKSEFLNKVKESNIQKMIECFKNSDDAFKTIEELLDPEKNGFKHMSFEEFIHHGIIVNREVWTGDDLILISSDKEEEIKNKLGI